MKSQMMSSLDKMAKSLPLVSVSFDKKVLYKIDHSDCDVLVI